MYNYLKLIENTSYCKDNIFIENLIKSNILEFLIDNFINKDNKFIYIIIDILINISQVETTLGKRLINIGIIKFLLNIINNKAFPLDMREASFIPMNNLISNLQLWKIVFFDQKVLQEFCSLLNNEDIEEGIFSEIGFGLYQLLNYCNDDDLNKLLEKYFLIQLICKAIKNIIKTIKIEEKICNCYLNFCCVILSLLNKDDNLKFITDIFKKSGGEELLDFILHLYINIEFENRNLFDKEEINNILDMAEAIKEKIKDL